MKSHGDETIRRAAATYLGRLTWIDWEKGEGEALLDAPEGRERIKVKCGFRFAGQHWIWQEANPLIAGDVEAYPEEEATSHSAFAFCPDDRVVLLRKAMDDPEEREADLADGGDGTEYVAVAVLEEHEEDDGAGGVVRSALIHKRKVWPLYRKDHEATVLRFGYREEGGRGAGFPFAAGGARGLVNPFLDHKGHARALGTIGGAGNPRLVVTREQDQAGEDVYIPHAIHEFCEADENIPYVADVFMRTEPNWRGRVVGLSVRDEVLIDNIPVARVTNARNAADITPSWRATTRWFVHIDERDHVLTVLHVTADCHFDWRTETEAGEPGGGTEGDWRPPKWAFHVRRGSTRFRCVYEAMEATSWDDVPTVALEEDTAASWRWSDLMPAVERKTWLRDTQIDNLSGETLEVVPPDGETEMWFWGGCKMIGVNAYDEARHDKRCKISLALRADQNHGLVVEKRIGDPVPWSPFNRNTLRSSVTLEDRDPEHLSWGAVLEDEAEILGYVEEEAARAGGNALVVRMSGHDRYSDDPHGNSDDKTCDTALTKSYWHRTPDDGDHKIAEEVQKLDGQGGDVRGTLSTVVFTLTDVRRGVYGFWEITWFEDAETKYVLDTTSRPPEPYRIKWRHYLWTRTGRTLTHSYDYEIPFCLNGPYTALEIDDRNSTVPDEELERSFVVRLLGVLLQTNDVKKWPTHRLWDVPRLEENGVEMKPTDICYKGNIFTLAPVHYISEFLQMCMSHRGGKKMVVTCEYETKFWVDRSILFRPYTFALHPFPNKYPWIWPHFRNLCRPTPSQAFADPKDFFVESGTAGILFSESMGYDGFATEDEYYYTVSIKGVANTSKLVWSPGMERLLTCTGRGDAVISVD